MKLIKEKTLPLLKRTRVTYELEHFKKPTPNEKEIIKQLSEKTKSSEDVISVLHIYPHFGREKSKIIANIYKSKEDKENFEKINKKKKKAKEGEASPPPAQEAAKKEEKPKEEAPKEEVKEAPKKEEKK
ncbi:MAG: hypothetical protein CMH64_02600 [Nanoarchaeota archaeon]|nr:hypothetical protein [Nanoarchaeota archaeon]|tara:strand:+ start:1042 stop:1428 length:387 start_codon:yes stop_codon:yes gene_type:complete